MSLSLRQIEAFRTVMIAGTMVRAAAMLRISQPAISRLVSDLESNLGYDLFTRTRGRLYPTEEGKALFAEVERAFVGLRQIENAGKAIGQAVTGTVRVIAMHALGMREGVDAVTQFCQTYEDVDVILDIGPRQLVLERLATLQADIGLATLPIEEPGIASEEVLRESWMCLLPAAHRLAKQKRVHARDLENEPFISFSAGSFDRAQVDGVFDSLDIPRRLRIETRTAETACNFVAQGAGVSILPHAYALSPLPDGAVLRPFDPTILLSVGILVPENVPIARRTRLLCDMLRERFAHS